MASAFQPKFVDLVRNFTSTTGIGNFVLGPVVNGFTGFAAACQVGDSFYYSCLGVDKPAEHEVGRGTLQANGTISRDPISGTKTNFSTGTKSLALIAAAEWFNAIQAGAGSASSAASQAIVLTRGDLATLSARPYPALLCEPGREGLFVWDGSNLATIVQADTAQGIYVAPSSDPTGTSGAWVRKFVGPAQATWFGMSGAATAAGNVTAFTAALATLKALRVTGFGYGEGSLGLQLPEAVCNLNATIEWDFPLDLFGHYGSGASGGGTVLNWTVDVTGLRPLALSAGSIIRNLYLHGAFAATESEAHGIHLKAKVAIRDVFIEKFAGDGIYGNTVADGSNLNDMEISHVFVQFCRNCIYLEGGDANAITITHPLAFLNRRYGVWTKDTIGNTLIGGDYSTNAIQADGTGIAMCSYLGNWYFVLPNQEVGASTNAPSGTTANNAWWAHIGTGGVDGQHRAWTSGLTWLSGGTVRIEGDSSYTTIIGGYSEPDQPPMQVQGHTTIVAPNMGVAVGFNGAPFGGQLYNANDGPQFPATLRIGNDNQDPSATDLTVNGTLTLTPPTGFSFDPLIQLNTTNVAASLAMLVNGVSKATIQYNGSNNALNFITSGLGTGFVFYNTNAGAALTDLIFQNTSGSHNLRYERRTGSFLAPSAQNTVYEFQIGTAAAASTIIGDGGIYTAQAIKSAGAVTGSNLSGTNTGDQTITLTGDVTGTGTGSFAATIGNSKVTLAKIANAAANSKLLGSGAAGSSASYSEITLGTGFSMSGTTLNFTETGTVQSVSITTANGVSGSVATATTTPAITLTLGAITPTSVAATGAVTSSGGGMGYATGAGGTVTQATSKSTAVTLNKLSGQVTTTSTSMAAAAVVSFTVSNSTIAATDTINLNLASGNATAGAYRYWVEGIAAGSFKIVIENRSAGALAEALVFNFAVLKAVNA